jgi:hypothetical protein
MNFSGEFVVAGSVRVAQKQMATSREVRDGANGPHR